MSLAILALAAAAIGARGAADLTVSLSPPRDSVSLVVYGNADLTLVREVRTVSLPAGQAELCLAWPGAAVDASSVSLRAPAGVKVSAAAQPPGKRDQMRWLLEAETAGPRELQITYFTSGIEWKPRYRLTLNEGTGAVELEGLVTIRNRSGQEFERSHTYLVVGELKLVENLAKAAWKALPEYKDQKDEPPPAAGSGLSERYVYDVGSVPRLALDDTYTLPFLPAATISRAEILYRLHPAKYGAAVHKVVVFDNTPDSALGGIPIAGAEAQVATVTASGRLPQGRAAVPYTPVGEDCEVDLGTAPDVVGERRVARQQRTSFEFDRFGQVEGYDDREWVEVELNNHSLHPIVVEYTDTVPGVWDVASEASYLEEGMNEVKFRIEMKPQSKEQLEYRLIKRQGKRVRLGPVRPK